MKLKHLSVLMMFIVCLLFSACNTLSESSVPSRLSESTAELNSEDSVKSSETESRSSKENTRLCQFEGIQFSIPAYCNYYRSTLEGLDMVYLYMNNQRARVVTYPYPDINDISEVNAENIQQSMNILLEGGDYQIKSWKLETIGNNSFLVFNYYYKPVKMDYPVYFLLVDNQMYVFLGLTFDSTGLKENKKFVYEMIETVTIVP